MTNNEKILGYLGISRKAGKLIFGTDACLDGLRKDTLSLIIVSKEASERTKNKFSNICNDKKITYIEWGDINSISKAIGKQNKAVIGIKDKNLSEAIKKIINGGEAIG